MDQFGWCDGSGHDREQWIPGPGNGRAMAVWQSGSVNVVEYRDEVASQGRLFCSVEAKGNACSHLTNEGMKLLLTDLAASCDVRASRLDLKVDTTALTPRVVFDAIQRGDFRSRIDIADRHQWIESPSGQTCYVGKPAKRIGEKTNTPERMIRFYDLRGPTRAELQLRKLHAAGACKYLQSTESAEWPAFMREAMAGLVEFVDRTASTRPARCPRLPFWDDFMQGLGTVSTRLQQERYEALPVGKLDGLIKQYSGALGAACEAFGDDWVTARIKYWSRQRSGEDHNQRVDELLSSRHRGLCGIPINGGIGRSEEPDEIPF